MTWAGRRERFKLHTARIIRVGLGVGLSAVIGVVAIYLVLHLKRAPSFSQEKKAAVPEKIDIKEGVQVSQFRGDRGRIEARGDKNYAVNDKTDRLEGRVEIVDYGRKGGREVRLNGDAVTYDKDWNSFKIQGNVRVREKDMIVDTSDLLYDRVKEVMTTSTGATVILPRLSGSAGRVVYYPQDNGFILENGLKITLRPRQKTGDPLVIEAGKLSYDFDDRRGRIETNVRISHGKSAGTADVVEFEQFAESDDLKALRLNGSVHLELVDEMPAGRKADGDQAGQKPDAEEPTIGRELSLNTSERQKIASDEVRLIAFPGKSVLNKIECRGHCSLAFFYKSGMVTSIQGESVDLSFKENGSFRDLSAPVKFRIAVLDKDQKTARAIEGAGLGLDAESSQIRVTGSGSEKARMTSPGSEILGDEIKIWVKADEFEARGGVRMAFRPSGKATDEKGFFSKDEPVNINASSVRYSSAQKRFLVKEQARVWQERRVLSAQDITLNEETGDLSCREGVLFTFPHKPKDQDKEQLVEISAGRMSYDRQTNEVRYEENCTLRTGAALLQAESITVLPAEGGGRVLSMRASRGPSKPVTIVMNAREASGDLAEYDVDRETIVLTGLPSIKEKNKGTARGDKLTFYLADGRIVVENRGQERSVAVIK
jgi:lipopolysaccharide transport protein LptA